MAVDEIRRIVVVGGGIAGLAAAYRLGQARRQGAPVDEYLIEAGDRLGGVIRTELVDGCVIEAGPDSFLREKPEAAALARELGLGDSLMGSNDAWRRTYILHQGRLERLPEGLMLLAPARLGPVLNTPLLPVTGKIAILREWLTGRAPGGPPPEADESIASFIGRHFGPGMLENIAEPLLAGVYGGDSASLSVRSVLSRFVEMEKKYGSLTRAAMAAKRRGSPNVASIFMTLRCGLGSLVESLAGEIGTDRVEFGRRAVSVEIGSRAERRYRICFEDGSSREADSVILALPAWASASLLRNLDPELSEQLNAIPYSSAVTVAMAYDGQVRSRLPQGFGFLVPRAENRRLLACTFVHAKFDDRTPDDRALLRCFLGGSRDLEILEASDEQILSAIREELRSILGIDSSPLFFRIYRWPRAMAQYVVGHGERLRVIAGRLREHPGLHLAGNAYTGIGISDAIRTGEAAVRQALDCLAPAAGQVSAR
jgi:protoporphyrinogen/coproporphyrinogen III oxidase